MSEYDADSVDWSKVERNLVQANEALRKAEQEIASGFSEDGHLSQLIIDADGVPRDVDELIKGVTNSSSYLRNGTMNFIPDN